MKDTIEKALIRLDDLRDIIGEIYPVTVPSDNWIVRTFDKLRSVQNILEQELEAHEKWDAEHKKE